MAKCGCGTSYQAGFGTSCCSSCESAAVVPTNSCLSTDMINIEVAVWDDPGCDGDNLKRVFNKDECVYHEGYFYWSKEDMNVDMPPSAKWSEPSTKCEMLKPAVTLKNCAGVDHKTGDRVPSCGEMAGAISTAISEIPDPVKPKNCAGVESDEFVGCGEMGEGLTWNPATGKYEVDTQDVCVKTAAGVSLCSDIKQLYVAEENGCAKFVVADNLNLTIGGYGGDNPAIDATGYAVLPLDPFDTSSYYTIPEIRTAHSNGDIDLAKLSQLQVSCNTVTFPCDADYEFILTANPPTDWDTQGEGAFIISVDGQFMENIPGVLKIFPRFTSVSGTYAETLTYLVGAGTKEVCVYQIGGQDVAGPAAQVLHSVNQPRLVIKRLISAI